MAQYPKSLVDFTCFVDGIGKAGKIDEGEAPNPKVLTEELMAGGMAGTVDIPQGAVEKMTVTFSMIGVEADYYRNLGKKIGMTLRKATSDGEATGSIIHQMRGLIIETPTDAAKRKSLGMVKNTMTVEYYKLTIDNEVIYEIDIMGKKLIVDGEDLLAGQRAALGL